MTTRPNSIILTPTPDIAYVRTGGLFSQQAKVSTSNILVRVPIIHEVTPVNLKAFAVTIEKSKQNCLPSKDVFVDIRSVFTLKIDSEHIISAVEQFGVNTFELGTNSLIHDVLEGVLREVTATMTLDELQEKRTDFTNEVTKITVEKLHKLGLVLLNTSILMLEQTNINFVNKENILGARAAAITMKEIQENRKRENDALRDNELLITAKDNETGVKKMLLDVEYDNQTVETEKQRVEFAKSKQIAIAQATAEQERESATALIQKDIAILVKNEERLKQEESLAKVQEKVNEAQTNSETVRLRGIKEREKEIAILDAQQLAESNAIKVKTEALASAEQVKVEAEANYLKVEQEAKAMERLALAKEKNYKVEAEGIRLKNEAENKLSGEIIQYNQRMELIKNLPSIIQAMVKPMESIKDIRVISANGLMPSQHIRGGSAGSGNGISEIYDGALKYKLQNATINALAKDVGIDLENNKIADLIPTFTVGNNEEK